VYSFGIICYECLELKEPWSDEYSFSYKIFKAVTRGERPKIHPISEETAPRGYLKLMKSSWAQDPKRRPEFKDILHVLQDIYFQLWSQQNYRNASDDASIDSPTTKDEVKAKRLSLLSHKKRNSSLLSSSRMSRSMGSILSLTSRRSRKPTSSGSVELSPMSRGSRSASSSGNISLTRTGDSTFLNPIKEKDSASPDIELGHT